MLPEDLNQNQNFLQMNPGWLYRPHEVRVPSPNKTGKTSTVGRSTLNFAWPDPPIHPTDCSETLGIPGSPHGRPLPQTNSTKTLSIMGNLKSCGSTSRPRTPQKTTKSESFPRVWRGKVTKKRGTRSSCVTPTTNATKKCLQNSTTKFSRKGSENHQKGKMEETTKTLRNHTRSSIHTKKGSYKV
jgi:hypothetical protein